MNIDANFETENPKKPVGGFNQASDNVPGESHTYAPDVSDGDGAALSRQGLARPQATLTEMER